MSSKPVKIMYMSPLAATGGHDEMFADMARKHKLPGDRGPRHLSAGERRRFHPHRIPVVRSDGEPRHHPRRARGRPRRF